LTRKTKTEVLPPARHAMAEHACPDTREMSRVYRLRLNNRLPSDDMTRLVYALKEIRAALEAEQASAEIVQVAAPFMIKVNAVHHVHRDGRMWPHPPLPHVLPLLEQLDRQLAPSDTTVVVPIESEETTVAVPIEVDETVVALPVTPGRRARA
jgi:hypothetical protein